MIGCNMFGVAKWMTEDLTADVKRFQEIGFTSLETNIQLATKGDQGKAQIDYSKIPKEILERYKIRGRVIWSMEDAEEKIATIRAGGLAVKSVHLFGVDTSAILQERIEDIVAFGKEVKNEYFVLSCFHMGTEKMEAFYPVMEELAGRLAEIGIGFLYHNHDSECRMQEGRCLLDRVMEACPHVGIELDVGWAQYAGADVTKLLRKYGDRIQLIHYKDYDAGLTPEAGARFHQAVGQGDLALQEITDAIPKRLKQADRLIIDQDDSAGDMFADLAIGYQNVMQAIS